MFVWYKTINNLGIFKSFIMSKSYKMLKMLKKYAKMMKNMRKSWKMLNFEKFAKNVEMLKNVGLNIKQFWC